MRNTAIPAAILVASLALAAPSFAGMQQDLADCPDPNRPTSAAACTRILVSGRLPKSQHYIAYFNRGWAYRQAGDLARARADFEATLKLNPRYAWAFYSRALIERDENAPDKAIADLERALEIDSKFAAAHAVMGELLETRGELARARVHYQRSLAVPPKGIDARSSQARARKRLEALDRQVDASATGTQGSANVRVLSATEKGPAASEAAPAPAAGPDCRRFVPAAGFTISVDCPK